MLLERLLERGKTSGRDDDNEESIKKRFSASASVAGLTRIETFTETSSPVIEYCASSGAQMDPLNSADRGSGKVLEVCCADF